MSSLIGEIQERKPSNTTANNGSLKPLPKQQGIFDPKTGFPQVEHRSKSAFAKAREAAKAIPSKSAAAPEVTHLTEDSPASTSLESAPTEPSPEPEDNWRASISHQNERRVQEMPDAERESERKELIERFGSGIVDLMAKIQQRRESTTQGVSASPSHLKSDAAGVTVSKSATGDRLTGPSTPERPTSQLSIRTSTPLHEPHHASRPVSPLPSALRSAPMSRKSSQRLRFSTGPADVHVYESAPSSPKRKPLLLPPPDPSDPSAIHLTYKGPIPMREMGVEDLSDDPMEDVVYAQPSIEADSGREVSRPTADPQMSRGMDMDVEEGTPEDIRRRYFPTSSSEQPALEWIKGSQEGENSVNISDATRYDLNGVPIPVALQASLPTHLGLHHHGDAPERAGYTLNELLLLSRSTVPAQRATMLTVLAKVVSHSAQRDLEEHSDLLSRVLAAALAALPERGRVGASAVQVLWACLVGTHDVLHQFDITTLVPLPALLSEFATHFRPTTQTLPYESLAQLLDILLHLTISYPTPHIIAEEILRTPDLLPSILHTFITSPSSPDPNAIELVDVLSQTSRAIAQEVVNHGIADTFLKFVVVLPTLDESPPDRYRLLGATLKLYTTLGRYGLYAITATTASEGFTALGAWLFTNIRQTHQDRGYRSIMVQYLDLLEVWTVCAIDPHKTSPSHEILWSQIVGWGWTQDVMKLRHALLSMDIGDQDGRNATRKVLPSLWNVLSAWLEGCAVNSVKAGDSEKLETMQEMLRTSDLHEVELAALGEALDSISAVIDKPEGVDTKSLRAVASAARLLQTAIRLAEACLLRDSASRIWSDALLHRVHSVCLRLAAHPLWDRTDGALLHPILTPISNLCASTAQLACRIRIFSPQQTLALLIRSMSCLQLGDEAIGEQLLASLVEMVTKDLIETQWNWSGIPPQIWSNDGLNVILPFLKSALRKQAASDQDAEPEGETPLKVIAPYVSTRHSIQEVTALSFPRLTQSSTNNFKGGSITGLPFPKDWCFAPLNALLHSATSPAFKTLPSSWDHSEVDVARATLLLARVVQQVTSGEPPATSALMATEEIVLGCMKVFMLEHGQLTIDATGNDSTTEVFRDDMVSKDMDALLSSCRIRNANKSTPPSRPETTRPNLEQAALPYLGPSTPFYQFYSDFLGLYDSVSFGHKTFGDLLIPPLAIATYPKDYRKLLWGDYPHVIRLLRMEPEDVVGSDLRDWLYPLEQDGEVLAMYLKALGSGRVNGFLRWIAVHHVASNIWPDLRTRPQVPEGHEPGTDTRSSKATKVLQALLGNANDDAIRDVILYKQPKPSSSQLLLPPSCFAGDDDAPLKRERFHWVVSQQGGERFETPLKGLLAI